MLNPNTLRVLARFSMAQNGQIPRNNQDIINTLEYYLYVLLERVAKESEKMNEAKVKKEIVKLDESGKGLDEISEIMVYGMGFSPEYSWELIRTALDIEDV